MFEFSMSRRIRWCIVLIDLSLSSLPDKNVYIFFVACVILLFFILIFLVRMLCKQVGFLLIRSLRLYLGCFGWVINLIYSTLFSNILHAFRYNITYAQNLGLSNRYALFTCSDLTSAIKTHGSESRGQ